MDTQLQATNQYIYETPDSWCEQLSVLSASFNYDSCVTSDILSTTTLSLHSFMRSSQAESIPLAVS